MAIEKDYPLRKGDTVLVRAIINFADGNVISAKISGYTTIYPNRADIESVIPAFEVGDLVYDESREEAGRVLAVDGVDAWVRGFEGFEPYWTARLADLHRSYPGGDPITDPNKPEPDDDVVEQVRAAMDMSTWAEAEGVTVRNADGSLTHDIGPFKPVASDAPVAASVLDKIAADPNVNPAFQTAIKE